RLHPARRQDAGHVGGRSSPPTDARSLSAADDLHLGPRRAGGRRRPAATRPAAADEALRRRRAAVGDSRRAAGDADRPATKSLTRREGAPQKTVPPDRPATGW